MNKEKKIQDYRAISPATVLIRGAAIGGTVAGGVFGFIKAEEAFSSPPQRVENVKTLSQHSFADEDLICTDPAGDEHPAWVDFTEVRWERIEDQIRFSNTLTGDPRGPNTKLRTDASYAIVFVNSQTREGEYYAYAYGGQKTEDTGVQIRQFSNPITDFDQDVPAIPNPRAKDDPILYQAGPEAIETGEGDVAFYIPAPTFDSLREGRELWPWTTAGTGHGNEKENGIQSFNKDHCQKEVTPTPTPSPTASLTATPIPSPPPTETAIATPPLEETAGPTPLTGTSTPEAVGTPSQGETPSPTATLTPKPEETPKPTPVLIPYVFTTPEPTMTPVPARTPMAPPPTGGGPFSENNNSSKKEALAVLAGGVFSSIVGLNLVRRKLQKSNPH